MYKEIFRCYIVPDAEGLKLCVGLKVGSPLKLYWERSNKINPQAIRVEYAGQRIGYIQNGSNAETACVNWHKQDVKLQAYVTHDNRNDLTILPIMIGCKAKLSPSFINEEDREL